MKRQLWILWLQPTDNLQSGHLGEEFLGSMELFKYQSGGRLFLSGTQSTWRQAIPFGHTILLKCQAPIWQAIPISPGTHPNKAGYTRLTGHTIQMVYLTVKFYKSFGRLFQSSRAHIHRKCRVLICHTNMVLTWSSLFHQLQSSTTEVDLRELQEFCISLSNFVH